MKFNFLLKTIISMLLILFSGVHSAIAIDDSILDPLNLKKPETSPKKYTANKYPLSTITSITSDSSSKTLTITAIPRVNSSFIVSGKTVEIVLLNSLLHPNLANKSYDWQYKLKNQLYSLASVKINENKKLKRVSVVLKFNTDISIQEVRVKKSAVNYTFIRNKSTSIRNKLNKNTLGKAQLSNNFNDKPLNKNSSTDIDSKRQAINMASIFMTKQNPIQNNINDLPDPVDPNKLVNNEEPQPQDYSRTENDFIDNPQSLKDFNRPEKTENKLLNINDYEDIIKLAISLENQNKPDDSIQKLNQAISLNASRPEAYKLIADIYLNKNDYPDAIENYENAIKNNDKTVEVIQKLAWLYETTNEYDKAQPLLEDLVSKKKDDADLSIRLANIYMKKKMYSNCINQYQNALQILKNTNMPGKVAKLHFNLGNVYQLNKNTIKAEDEFKEAIATVKEFPDPYYNLGAIYLDQQDYELAKKAFKAFIKYSNSPEDVKTATEIINQIENANSK